MLNIFIQVLSLNNKERTMLVKYSYIKINSTGNISIFNDRKNGYFYWGSHSHGSHSHAPEPGEIYINGIQQNEIKSIYYFNRKENSVKLEWKSDTSSAKNMEYMFYECSSLTSLNLSNFDTSKVTDMEYMFSGCSSLTSLNLSNFDTSKVINMDHMFSSCRLLEFLDLKNSMIKGAARLDSIFTEVPSNITVCCIVILGV